MNQLALDLSMAPAPSLHTQLWLTYDISDDDGTTDSAFAEIFERKYGYLPDEVVRESYRVVTRVWVGPIKKENHDGPLT